ncbi:MAG: amino acid permease [Streptosporangiaceae bacterium]|nr:amino acid permease [Streptosporangiaceae bacterium]
MAVPRRAGLLDRGTGIDLPESFGYSLKRRLLGPPLVNEQLSEQRLSKKLALGVLSPDGISSSAYGTEEMLIELLPLFGLTAYALILPMTGVILFVMTLVVLSYREIVTVYTRAGGSYVVARENFGPRIAQIAAVALLIDYVVTVAVQVAAGTAAIASAVQALGPYSKEITIGVILLMCYGNLRGIREAGRAFALPTYLFSGSVLLMIAVGLVREAVGKLPTQDIHVLQGTVSIGAGTQGVVTAVAVFTLLRSFANGGSSLTGIEAVSNAVSAFKPPEGINARKVLVAEGLILGTLVAGISWLAHLTHAIPYNSGYPTVISQEARMVFGSTGHFMYFVVQAATALILYTGGNTSFNGFPFLTSFVAEDSFLPRWMMKRGHRLVFSNGIIVLTVASVALIAAVGSNVNRLVPFYAIGVFTAFSMAGFGMAKYHHTHKEAGWRHKLVINFSAGVLTAIVVVIFAVVKFTEGAWLIVILFPVLVFALIRLNREYRMEADVLQTIGSRRAAGVPPRQPNYSRRVSLVFVDSVDLSTFAAMRYARGLRPTTLRAVHFVIDNVQAEKLRQEWLLVGQDVPLDLIDTPDRRLLRASAELVTRETEQPGTHVTVVLPRRSYAPLIGRLLHDRTADKIAAVVSRVPNSAATIIPFDVESRVQELHDRQQASEAARRAGADEGRASVAQLPPRKGAPAQPARGPGKEARRPDGGAEPGGGDKPAPPKGVCPIGSLGAPGKVTVEGRVRSVEIRPVEQNCVFETTVADGTGELTAMFYGRTHIPGVEPGSKLRLHGKVHVRDGRPTMINPAYELLPRSPAS